MKQEVVDLKKILNGGFYIKKEKKPNTSILMIHGFLESDEMFKPLASYLKKDNFDIYSIILPGHKTNVTDLSTKTHKDWINASLEAYNYLSKEYKKVIVIGFSLGGTLALEIASKKTPYKVITISAPVMFFDLKFMIDSLNNKNDYLKYALNDFRKRVKEKKLNNLKFKIIENKTDFIIGNIYKQWINSIPDAVLPKFKKFYFFYDDFSYSAVKEVVRITSDLRKRLYHIKSPYLCIHSKKDYLISPRNANEILGNISSDFSEKFILKHSPHNCLLGKEYNLVNKKIREFIIRDI
ncbi:MAG: alpha/beta fold hydrolase [archaeon]